MFEVCVVQKISPLFLLFWTLGFLAACTDSNPVITTGSEEPGVEYLPVAKPPFSGNSPVVISEINTVNLVYEDHEGGDAGWIELYNRSSDTVNLSALQS